MTDVMREVLTPDFTYTNASGISCDREEYINAYVTSADAVEIPHAEIVPKVKSRADIGSTLGT